MVVSPTLADFKAGAPYRRELKQRGKVKTIICHSDNRICFLITETKTIVRYNIQTFILEPIEVPGNLWARRLERIKDDITKRKIDNMADLIGECKGAVNIIPVRMEWYV